MDQAPPIPVSTKDGTAQTDAWASTSKVKWLRSPQRVATLYIRDLVPNDQIF